jgi:hypothetical protein
LVQRFCVLPSRSYSLCEDVEVGRVAAGCSNGRIASGRRVGVAPLTRRAGRVHGCTNGPAIGGYCESLLAVGLVLIAIVHQRFLVVDSGGDQG